MARHSVYTNVTARSSIAPGTHTATVTGSGVSRIQGDDLFRTAMVVVQTGTVTDGSHTIEVQESDDNSTFTAAPDRVLQGTEPSIGASDDGSVFFVGYIGTKRYLRVVSTVSGATSGGAYSALVVLGEPSHAPVSHS